MPDNIDISEKRLERIAANKLMRQKDIETFRTLEAKMNSTELGSDLIKAFHTSSDSYPRLLELVLRALVSLNEPYAKEKYSLFLEEKGTMLPALFLTPWELTLDYLDKKVGKIEELKRFYL